MQSSVDGVVAVVCRLPQLLIIRRSQKVIAPLTYCFPGGGLKVNEGEKEALRREFREELNAAIHPIRRLWQSVTPWNVTLAWWLARLPECETPVANPAEVDSWYWLSAEEIQRLPGLLESNRQFFAAWRSGEFELHD